jgi:hypothetical protein
MPRLGGCQAERYKFEQCHMLHGGTKSTEGVWYNTTEGTQNLIYIVVMPAWELKQDLFQKFRVHHHRYSLHFQVFVAV